MDAVQETIARDIEARWKAYEAHPSGNWPLRRRDGLVQEILDGNVEAYQRLRPAGATETFVEVQQRIVDAIQQMEEKTHGYRDVVRLVLNAARKRASGRPVRLLEAASGSGWLQKVFWEEAQRTGLPVELTASDYNPELVRSLTQRFQQQGVPCSTRLVDARSMPDVPDGHWDIAFMTYTLHHLPPPDAALCLRELDRVSGGGLVLVDIARRPLNLLLIDWATRLFTRGAGRYALHDGLASVRRGYTVPELKLLLEWVGLAGKYRVGPLPTWHPQRLIANAIWPAE